MWRYDQRLEVLVGCLGKSDEQVKRLHSLAVLHPDKLPEVVKALQALAIRRGMDPANTPPFTLIDGTMPSAGLHVGTQMFGEQAKGEFYLRPEELLGSHLLVAGVTGWEKSLLLKYVLAQLVEMAFRVCIFDSESEYFSFVERCGLKRCWYIHADDDKDNPLEPPNGVGLRKWLASWKRSVREVMWCREGMIILLGHCLENLIANLRSADSGTFPTISDLYSLLKNMRFQPGTRGAGYHESLLDRVTSLLENLGPMLDCQRSYPLDGLSKRSVVYDISSLRQEARLFTLHLKLLKMLMFREAQLEAAVEQAPSTGTDLFVVEKAHRSTARVLEKRPDLGEPLLYDLVRTGRKRGERFIFVEQVIAGIPYQILGNINSRIIGRITDGRLLRDLALITEWDDDQIDYIRELPLRHWVVQTPLTPDGIVVRVPELKV
jgi:hypothetical protein